MLILSFCSKKQLEVTLVRYKDPNSVPVGAVQAVQSDVVLLGQDPTSFKSYLNKSHPLSS